MLKVGDTIKCISKEEMATMTTELGREGIYTDFVYEKDGEQGYWLRIVGTRFRSDSFREVIV